jgi:hypothetical protein
MVIVVGIAAGVPAVCGAECPYLPAYTKMSNSIQRLPPAPAAAALEKYTQNHENPEACELIEIDRKLGELERHLFALTARRKHVKPQVVYRCNKFDSVTARCDGPMADGTAHFLGFGIAPLSSRPTERVSITTERRGAAFQAAYSTSLRDILDGKAAVRLQTGDGMVTLPGDMRNMVLIAIFKTDGLWQFRKVVWYF